MKSLLLASLLLASLLLAGCATSSIFAPLGSNISAPNGMVIDAAAGRLYLVNSNSNVLYDWEEGSVQIYDITDPLNPRLIDTAPTDSFSGEAVLDAARKLLYTTNRFSEESTVAEDHLLIVNIDEGSGDFLNVGSAIISRNPYGLFCCYPADRMWIASEGNDLEYIDLADLSTGSINLLQNLSNGGSLTKAEADFITVKDNQAFLPRKRGGLMIVNLDEAGDSSKNALDYWAQDFRAPAGVATDGTYIYLVDEEEDDGWKPYLFILDASPLPPLPDNDATQVVDKDDSGIIVAQIEVCKDPQQVSLSSQYAFVTCKNGDGDGIVSVVDIASKTLVANITVGKQPFETALYSSGGVDKYLYVGNIESNTLSIIDVATLTVAATYP